MSISVRYFGSAIHRGFEQIQAQLSDVSAVAQEALSGVRVVRAYRQEAHEIERFRASNEEYLRRNRRLIAIQGFFFPSMSFFLGLGALVVLWLGSRDVIRGRITLGEFVAFIAYLTMLSWPMIAFGWVTNMLQRGMASLEADAGSARYGRRPIRADTQSGQSSRSAKVPRSFVPFAARSNFAISTFALRRDAPVLEHVSARIEAGQTVALVGADRLREVDAHQPAGPAARSAARHGVSSTASTCARCRSPTLRGAIGFVPQEPFLFSDTIADNVAFGLDANESGGRGWQGGGKVGPVGPEGRSGGRTETERRQDRGRRGRRASRQGRRRLPARLRHDGRRARDHALGRPEAAHGPRARDRHRSARS